MLSTLFMKEAPFLHLPPVCARVCVKGLLSVTRVVCRQHPQGRSIVWCWLVRVCLCARVCHAMCAHNTMAAHLAE